MKLIPLTVILLLILIGCGNNEVNDYQIISSYKGSMYRLNKSTGDVWYIHKAIMKKVKEEKFRLKVGERYICEDGYSFVYKGKGQVRDIKSLEDF